MGSTLNVMVTHGTPWQPMGIPWYSTLLNFSERVTELTLVATAGDRGYETQLPLAIVTLVSK